MRGQLVLTPTLRWATRRFRAMGTSAEVLVLAAEPERLADWVVDEVTRLEGCWTRFRPESELSRVNAVAGTGPVSVSPTLLLAFSAAAEMHELTGGRFDPTILPALEALGYDRTFTEIDRPARRPGPVAPSSGRRSSERRSPGFRFGDVGIDPVRLTVTLPPGAAVDLGGIGKGLAADLVVDEVRARGAESVCLSLGGDIAVRGPGPGADACWPITVRDSASGEAVVVEFPLVDEAIVQSTTALRRWTRGGRTVHHIVDPASGACTDTDVASAIVTGPSAARAECVAKAAIVAGRRRGVAMIVDAGLDGWLVGPTGVVTATPLVAAGAAPGLDSRVEAG